MLFFANYLTEYVFGNTAGFNKRWNKPYIVVKPEADKYF